MPNTYRARLRGNVLEWLDEIPVQLPANEAIEVDVTVLTELPRPEGSEQGRRMAAALERIAQRPTRSLPSDPVAWQREVREDRKLPGRGDGC